MPTFVLCVAFLGDYAFVLGRMAMVFYAIRLGADTATVLVLGGIEGLVYTLTAGRLAGPFVARFGSRRLIRFAATALALEFVMAGLVGHVSGLVVLFALGGFPLSLFWPAVHARIVERSAPAMLHRVQAQFNLTWTVAILFAFATGGWLFESGYRHGLGPWVALGAAAVTALGVLLMPLPEGRIVDGAVAPDPHVSLSVTASGVTLSEEGLLLFGMAGWLGNFGSYAVYDAVRLVFPSLGPELGYAEGRIGLFIAIALLAQGTTFVVTTRWKGWVYRRWWLYTAFAMHAAALLLFTVAQQAALFILGFALVGSALAATYAASLFYSLGATRTAGHAGGRHESMIGLARVSGPLLGATAAYLTDSSRAPFIMYLIVIVILMMIYVRLFSKLSRDDRAAIQGRKPPRVPAV